MEATDSVRGSVNLPEHSSRKMEVSQQTLQNIIQQLALPGETIVNICSLLDAISREDGTLTVAKLQSMLEASIEAGQDSEIPLPLCEMAKLHEATKEEQHEHQKDPVQWTPAMWPQLEDAARSIATKSVGEQLLALTSSRPASYAALTKYVQRTMRGKQGIRAFVLDPVDVFKTCADSLDERKAQEVQVALESCCKEDLPKLADNPQVANRILFTWRHIPKEKMGSLQLARWILSQAFVPIPIPPADIVEELKRVGVVHDAYAGGLAYCRCSGLPSVQDVNISRLFAPCQLQSDEDQKCKDITDQYQSPELMAIDSFDDMDLSDNLLRGIYSYGFEKPSPIQAYSIKPMVQRYNFIGQAQSGTGKTGAYIIAALQRINYDSRTPQVLLLAPGRELVMQILKVFLALGDYLKVRCHACLGGTSVRDDIDRLRSGQHVVVGTTGRIVDMIQKQHLRTGKTKMVIIDEVDSLLSSPSDGQKISDILRHLPREVQICAFSATVTSSVVKSLESRMPRERMKILVSDADLMVKSTKHFYLDIEKEEWKLDSLCDLYESLTFRQALVFCNSRRKVDYLHSALSNRDFPVSSLHSDLDQKERDLVMREFRSGSAKVLLTTNLLARGIDVQSVSVVLNYDLPGTHDEYLHQAGRCSRFGRKGIVINFVTNDVSILRGIEEQYKIEMTELPMDFADLM
eukprot:gnl/MRDRNA2_/MRDRNA2_111784_c0_seq1.p1 gnl/MRDRNA2_/MRDRNA2_111784_c0~~gnl/MRDRNA2_/MRDRNA2_111784_c0_seq1.p1  ORF type:complete len:689 (-),score=130.73 gnl/MRDRNA2_/MRDRNA2_111784_c0_seq1:211-2277(-)